MTSKTNIAPFFDDFDVSSVISLKAQSIAAPIVRGQDITTDELMLGGGIRIVYFIIDRSPSMHEVAQLLIDGFNDEYIPATKEAREDDISVLRIGGMSFSSNCTPLWLQEDENKKMTAFHALEDLPKLSKADYNPFRGQATAQYKAIIEGTATVLRYGSEEVNRTGTHPEVDVIILADGDNNDYPLDIDEPRKVIQGANKSLIRYSYLYFETEGGSQNPRQAAIDLGISPENIECFNKKPGETDGEYRSRFRRLMRVMSKISAGGDAATAVAAAVAAEDDDII